MQPQPFGDDLFAKPCPQGRIAKLFAIVHFFASKPALRLRVRLVSVVIKADGRNHAA